jgi:hypothetical protein
VSGALLRVGTSEESNETSLPNPVAFSTCSGYSAPVSVLLVERVPVFAVGFAGIKRGWTHTAQYVRALSHDFHVARVDAMSDRAQMIDGEPFRYGADKLLVGPTMGFFPFKLPVSARISASSPEPTRLGLLDLLPKAIKSWAVWARDAGRRFIHTLLGLSPFEDGCAPFLTPESATHTRQYGPSNLLCQGLLEVWPYFNPKALSRPQPACSCESQAPNSRQGSGLQASFPGSDNVHFVKFQKTPQVAQIENLASFWRTLRMIIPVILTPMLSRADRAFE